MRIPWTPSHSTTPSISATLPPSYPSTPTPNSLDPFAIPFVPSLHAAALSKRFEEVVSLDEDVAEHVDRKIQLQSPQDYSLDDPTAAFVQVKMQIASLTTHRRPGETADASFLWQLRRRLEDIKNDYLFNEDEAESAYQVERNNVDITALQARLRGDDLGSRPIPQPVATPTRRPVEMQSTTHVNHDGKGTPEDFFADSDDETPGGLFELLDEMPTTETTPQGITIAIRDMSLPKHYSGHTPKTLLQETVRKLDRYAITAYRTISGASRAKRAAVAVRWDGSKSEEWVMEDVACHDSMQAEQYISTVALHALSFPKQQGFALGVFANAGSQTSYKVLPPVFRDLWGELEEQRRQDNDFINRGIWSRLKCILEPKLASGSKVSGTLRCSCEVSLS